MFGLLTRTPRRAAPSIRPVRSVRLGLEALETRYCPASLSLAVAYGTQNNVTLSGDLTGTNSPGGQTIQIGGPVSGVATTDANGHYSITLQENGYGTVGASWMVNGMAQATAMNMIVPPPNIDQFSATMQSGDIWTFSGHVTDPNPNGLVIQFGGLSSLTNPNATATVNASGYFSYTVQLNGTSSDNGTAWAETTDGYGQQSNTAMFEVVQSA